MNRDIKVTKQDLMQMVYFIMSKFEFDVYHMQGTSSKSDLLGGFIDRWINRIPEVLVFNKLLLENKDYKIINDFFIYGNDSDKNAPDVIGLSLDNKKIIKFAEFYDTTWKGMLDMPWIEVKTFKKNQKMFTVRDTQMEDEHYYVMAESDIEQNYLKILFDEIVFDDKFYANILMNNTFIQSNVSNSLQQPQKVEKFNKDIIGTIKLLGIYKGKDIKKISNLCPPQTKPYYFDGIELKEGKIRGLNILALHEDSAPYGDWEINKEVLAEDNYINTYGQNLDNIQILKKNKSSWYIETTGFCELNGEELMPNNKYKLIFKLFDRNSNWNEYITLKSTLDNKDDRTDELIEIFDRIVEEK